MIRKCIDDLGSSKDVETNEHYVVREQHESREGICNFTLAKDVVTEITC